MTGIERLRELADLRVVENRESVTLRAELRSIADQIDREQDEHARCQLADYLRVRAVERDMERHCLGHEGMEDSPVARWARELRAALGGRDEEVTDVATIRKDAYDAYEWVRKHGGLDIVRRMFRDADSRRVELCGALGIDLDKGWSEAMAAMRLRLMPEGMEWPRFEDGEPVRIGSDFGYGVKLDSYEVTSILFTSEGCFLEPDYSWEGDDYALMVKQGVRVKRPAPKVLDADGAEIRVGDTVWHVHDLDKFTVTNSNNGENLSVSCMGEDGKEYCCYPNGLTHRAPVLAADGKPERPDSWERWRKEWQWPPVKYCELILGVEYDHDTQLNEAFDAQGKDLVRRARALAECGGDAT